MRIGVYDYIFLQIVLHSCSYDEQKYLIFFIFDMRWCVIFSEIFLKLQNLIGVKDVFFTSPNNKTILSSIIEIVELTKTLFIFLHVIRCVV